MNALARFQDMKRRGEKFAVLTCYDASFAALMENAGIDALLVGDSLGMVLQGSRDTLGVSMQDMCYHTRCVAAGATSTFIIADMPAGSDTTPDIALANARLLIDAGAHMIKLEGIKCDVVRHLTANGIAVCGHLGFTPQTVHELGGYKVQGRDPAGAQRILDGALELQQAGASLMLLEMVPATLGQTVTTRLDIPTIGIGAGPDCDAQVLVLYDILGIYAGKTPRFSRNFMEGAHSIRQALEQYVAAVKNREFPGPEHCF